jgi:phosphoglycolate phosphatase-like HAD superfamily hydrolase
MQTVKDLTIEEFKAVVGEAIEEKLRELLTDPDTDLTLRPEVQERLRNELQEPQPEIESIPVEEVARRRGLEW